MRKWLVKTNCRLLLAMLVCACSSHQEEQVVWESGLEVSEDSIAYQQVLGEPEQGVLAIEDDVDLKGKVCCLPENVTMKFCGGIVKNGTLVGDGTKIASEGACFDRVRILGTWDVPEISTSMFKDLNYDNSLKDVVALANPDIKNRIVIEEGDYQVTAFSSGDACVTVCSNTELVMNGNVRLAPNDYDVYFVFRLIGNNVSMMGSGTIIGDKYMHTGETGEWGMGIDVRDAHDVNISGLTVKNCWGDCIYVGEESTDVLIENCRLDHGRRQGISITAADRVLIKDCIITNVEGTAPEYGIDVEPNGGDVVDHVTIENVTVRDCRGGFLAYGRATDARVGTVTIRDCDVTADYKTTIAADKCDTLIVENCNITQNNTWGCVSCNEVGHGVIKDNTLYYDKGIMARLKDWARPKFGKKRVKVMDVDNCGTTMVEQNQEREL